MNLLPYYVAIPMGLAFLITLLSKWWKGSGEVLATGGMAVLAAMALGSIGSASSCYHMGGWIPPVGIALMSDGLTVLLLIAVNVIGFICILFSLRYMKTYTGLDKYYALFMLMVTGMNGLVVTADVFNMFVFLEIASIASYALVAFGIEADELEAGFKYLILGSVASTMVLFAIGTVYAVTGSLNIADISREIATKHSTGDLNPALLLSAAFFLMGFGLKAALVPFHAWLPDAHPSAPAPISAMLSGVVIKSLGIYAMCRVFFHMFGFSPALPSSLIIANSIIAFSVLSMVVGVLMAIGQWDLKRLLAYHSISQMGYVGLGLGVGARVLAVGGPPAVAALAIMGGLFHLLNHAAFKSLLFLCSGSIEHATGTRQLKWLGGLRQRMPVTSGCCSIASLSIAGVPPFNGFWSKLMIIIAVMQAGHWALGSITVAVSFVTLMSFIKVQRYVIFGEMGKSVEKAREAPATICVSLVLLAIACVGLGLLYPVFGGSLLQPARDALMDGAAYVKVVLG